MAKSENQITDIDTLEQYDELITNNHIQLTPEDEHKGVKVFCNEDYAQSLYDLIVNKTSSFNTKDLEINTAYYLYLKKYDFEEKLIHCEEKESRMPVYIPASQYDGDILNIHDYIKEQKPFLSFIYKKDDHHNYYASNVKYKGLQLKEDLWQKYHNKDVIEVKLVELVKGGYIAMYQDTIKCFMPGSQVEANIPSNFEQHVGKTMPVVIANYDSTNDLFFVSYKEYINVTFADKIKELRFDTLYTGVLTSNPLKYGIFVEIDQYFTGLIHSSEFDNYQQVMNTYQTGDKLNVYIKNIFKDKKGKYKITLTLDYENIDGTKKAWQNFKTEVEDNQYNFEIIGNNSIKIIFEDREMNLKQISNKYFNKLKKANKVKINEIDIVHENMNFDPIYK